MGSVPNKAIGTVTTIICRQCKEPFENQTLHMKSSGKKICPECLRLNRLDYLKKRRDKIKARAYTY